MSRVKAVVGRSIMVAIEDIRPNDILKISGNESDPIIYGIEQRDGQFRFHYVPRAQSEIQKELGITPVDMSNWMTPGKTDYSNGYVFIHDLMNEREEFNVTTRS